MLPACSLQLCIIMRAFDFFTQRHRFSPTNNLQFLFIHKLIEGKNCSICPVGFFVNNNIAIMLMIIENFFSCALLIRFMVGLSGFNFFA